MEKNYLKHRAAAIAWLNSRRDFYQGISILEKSGFKPTVVARLRKDGIEDPSSAERLKHLMRTLVKAWALTDEELQDTDAERGIVEGQELKAAGTQDVIGIRLMADKLEKGEAAAPKPVRDIVFCYRNAYVERERLHRLMADLGEGADEQVVQARRKCSDEIERLCALMDSLYPEYEAYIKQGKLPGQQSEPEPGPIKGQVTNENQNFETLTTESLKFLRKSVATKILRARNRLEFQAETKQAQPNPMPDGPERLRYETKIKVLTTRLDAIRTELAKRVEC